MKKIVVGSVFAFILLACTNAANDNNPGNDNTVNGVDTSVIGSDNPNPAPDTTGDYSKPDSLKNYRISRLSRIKCFGI